MFSLLLFNIDCSQFWRRQWHPTPVLLPGESHGQRSLAGYSPWGSSNESNLTNFYSPQHSLCSSHTCLSEGLHPHQAAMDSETLQLLFLLPATLFCQMSTLLTPSTPSCFHSQVCFHNEASPDTLFKNSNSILSTHFLSPLPTFVFHMLTT